MGKRNSRFEDDWFDEEDYQKKPKHQMNKRKEMRMERALRLGDVDAYLEEEDEW